MGLRCLECLDGVTKDWLEGYVYVLCQCIVNLC